jgi:hypothetical protein
MQDVELFLSLAEIAGVFVGFGALIALRGGTGATIAETSLVGMVVWMGVQVVGLALAPVAISRFGVTGHLLWFWCSVAAIVVLFIGDELVKRISPERRALLAATPMRARVRMELYGLPVWLLMTALFVLVLVGVMPDQEEALYFAALCLLLGFDAVLVLLLATSGASAWRTTLAERPPADGPGSGSCGEPGVSPGSGGPA